MSSRQSLPRGRFSKFAPLMPSAPCARSTRCPRSRRRAFLELPSTQFFATLPRMCRRSRLVSRRRASRFSRAASSRPRSKMCFSTWPSGVPRDLSTAAYSGARGHAEWSRGVIPGFWKTIAVARKERRQIRRDRRTLLILLFVPAFFLLIYGYALNFDIRHVRLALQDNDRSAVSRELVSAFVNSGYFDLVGEAPNPEAVDDLLDRGDARAVLVIPTRFGADVAAGRRTAVQFIVNGDNANTATTVVSYAMGLVNAQSQRYELQARIGSAAGPVLTVEP